MLGLIALSFVVRASAPAFSVSWPQTIMGQYSGRIYLFVGKGTTSEPRLGSGPDSLGPVAVVAVKNAKPDTDVAIDLSNAAAMSGSFDALPSGDYMAQAVIDRNPGATRVGDADGDPYSAPVSFKVGASGEPVKLVCDQVVMEPTVHQGKDVKVVEVESTPLSNAQRRSYIWRAVVVLPAEYFSDPKRKFPVVVDIPDVGQSYTDYPNRGTNKNAYVGGKPVLYVRLDPDGPSGYHLFNDSPSAGPWATALEQEFLPYVEKEYHGDSTQVSLTGTGGGGWSALWLLATNPDAFTSANAIDPYAVDFHQFHGLNLYSDESAYTDAQGSPRKWQRTGAQTWQEHADVEKVLRGLELGAWEADFSPKAKNGKPLPLFDRGTGRIDPAVAKAWQAYDLDAYLKDNWASLGSKLSGKVTIISTGSEPDFSDDALQMLKSEADGLGAKFSFQVRAPSEIARS